MSCLEFAIAFFSMVVKNFQLFQIINSGKIFYYYYYYKKLLRHAEMRICNNATQFILSHYYVYVTV